jgi:nitrate reductase gamma subunit
MSWYIWLIYCSLAICLISCFYHFFRLVKYGKPEEYSQSIGDVGSATFYSLTSAMSPLKKESAYLHLPTYTAGLIYHIGTFLSIILFFIFLFDSELLVGWIKWITVGIILCGSLSGVGILIKRIVKKQLLDLSNPDDFISNILVNLFQLSTVLVIINNDLTPIYFVITSILLLYLPLGKLKHTVYFFAARYHLGFFYGWRGVWPPK